MILMDGKNLQLETIEELKLSVERLSPKPKLVIIQIGHDEPSNKYINQKKLIASKIGIDIIHINYEEDVKEEEVLSKIDEYNIDKSVTGIMVQLPLPDKFNEEKIINRIDPIKDVDGITTTNIGKLFDNKECFIPCTALGVMELIHKYNIKLEGKNVVIVGRSNLIGKPLIACFLKENATVTVTHSKTVDLGSITSKADILVVGVGKAHFIKEDMVKEGAIIIDVGTDFVDGVLTGDVDFESVAPKASYITPVPNGVGRMTVTSLMKNVIIAYNTQKELNN